MKSRILALILALSMLLSFASAFPALANEYVCYIGEDAETGTMYKSIKEAIESLGSCNRTTIHLLCDTTWDSMTISGEEDFAIDGTNPDGENFKVTLLGNVTVKVYSTRAYFTNVTIDLNQYHFHIGGNGEMHLESGAVLTNGYDSTNGGGAAFVEAGYVYMYEGSVVENCEAKSNGGAFRLNGAKGFNMQGGTIRNCVSGDKGGAIAAVGSGSKVTLTGGTIEGNTAVNGGGAIYVDSASKINVSGSTEVTGNTLSDETTVNNLEVSDSSSLTVTGALTGEIGITMTSAKKGSEIGNVSDESLTELTGLSYDNGTFDLSVIGGKIIAMGDYVCYIGDDEASGTKYKTLKAAIEGAGDKNVTIHLVSDALWEGMNATAGADFIITGENGDGENFKVKLLGNVTVRGYSNRAYFGNVTVDLNGYHFNITGNGEMTLNDGAVIENGYDTASGGGCAFVEAAKFTMNEGSLIKNCEADSVGGALRLNGATFTMNGGTIENCIAEEQGGAIAAVGSGSKVTLTGGEIKGNTAKIGGGGIYSDASSTVSLSGGIKITGNTLSEDDSANNLETVSADKLTLTGNLTGKVGLTFPNAKNGTVIGSADSTAFTGAENIYADSDSELTGTINEESKLIFEKRSAEEITLEEIKKKAEKELNALTDGDISTYIAEIASATSEKAVYDILDDAAEELGAEVINLPYNKSFDITSAEILYQGVSSEGEELSDTSVVKAEASSITATGLGRAVVKSGEKKYLVKTEKAKMAVVLVTGQSNSAGAESNYEEAPSATGDYKGRFLVTNSMDWTLSVDNMSMENAVYTAENGGKPENPVGSWSQFTWGAGTANQLGARLSDEWDMTIWVVNAGRSGYRMEYFDPAKEDHHGYNTVVKYMNKAFALIEEDGHYEVDEEKTGMFWIQGCSNSGTSMDEYRTMFMNMYEGFSEDLGINYAGIWLVRAGKSTNVPEDFNMTGPRLAQLYMANSSADAYKNIYLLLNTDIWRYDEGVKNHFINRYADEDKFKEYYGYELPETLDTIKPGIHYSQKGYNEMGDIAGEVISKIMNGNSGSVTKASLYDYNGNPVTEDGFALRANEKAVAVPVIGNVYYNASFNLTVVSDNPDVAVFDSETFEVKGVREGETTIKLCYGETLLASYPVKVTEAENPVCYIGDSYDTGIMYSNLYDAIMAAEKKTVHLISDTTIPSGTEIPAGTKFSLDGKGSGGNYKVKLLGNLKITGYGTEANFSNVTFDLNGYQFFMTGTCKVTLNDGAVLENGKAGFGGAAFVQSGTFTMNEGSIVRNCISDSDGGAFSLNGATFNMTGGEITGCSAKTYGGAISAVRETSKINITGGKIAGNKASNGGGIYVNNVGTPKYLNVLNLSGNPAITGNTYTDGTAKNNVETTGKDAFVLKGHLTGSIGFSFDGAKEGTVIGKAESNTYEGAANIVSDKKETLYAKINEDGSIAFASLQGSGEELLDVKENAKKELKVLTGNENSEYVSLVDAAEDIDSVLEILDDAADDLGAETVTLKYKETYNLASAEILCQTVSTDGKACSDSTVISYENSVITATGLGRAVVKAGGKLYIIKGEKAPIAVVLISGQSNSAGAYSDYTLAPKATGEYEGKFFITNTLDSDIPEGDISFETATYTAKNGGRPQSVIGNWAPEGNKWGAGAASALGARLSDEWEMPVWVVNTGVCAQIMDRFDPANSNPSSYAETVKYVKKVKSVIEDDGHYVIDDGKTGLFWIQGCSDGIGTSSENTMAEYKTMFANMYTGLKNEIGINYAGIWLVRAGTNSNGDVDFYMSGPRMAQLYLANSAKEEYKNIYLIFNTDVWRTDAGVKAYFEEKYTDADEFYDYYGYEIPEKASDLKPDIHYRQKGYNELGDEAGNVISKILNGSAINPTASKLLDYYGNEVTEEGIETAINETVIAVPVADGIYYNASANLTVKSADETIAVYDNESFTVKGLKAGETTLDIYKGSTKLSSYKVKVIDEVYDNSDCYIGDDYETGVKYESFVDAIKAANGKTVHLLRDVTWPSGNIGTGGGFVVDGTNPEGGTFKITLSDNSTILNEKSGAFKNVTIDLAGKHFQITGTGSNVSTIVIKEGVLIKNGFGANGGFAIINAGGVVIMEGGKIENCSATSGGGAIHVNGGTLTMTGGTITGNKASSGGGVIVAQTGTLNVSGNATVTGNTKLDGTTAENVKLTDHDSFNLAGALTGKIGITISAAGKGMQFGIAESTAAGAENIFMDSDTLKVGSIKSGKLCFPIVGEAYIGDSADEGVIYDSFITAIKAANGDTVHLLKDVIWPAGNIGTTGGYVLDGKNPDGENFTVKLADDIQNQLRIVNEAGGAFSNVTIDLNGKHLELMSTDSGATKPCIITLKSGAVIKNGYAANGGAAIIYEGAHLYMEEGSLVTDCRVTGGGGAFHVNDGTLSINGGTITGNKASSGAGVVVTAAGKLEISGKVNITGNTFNEGGTNNVTLNDEDSLVMTGDVDGTCGITFGNAGSEFGVINGDFDGAYNFVSDSDAALRGFASKGKLIFVPGKIALSTDYDTGVYVNGAGEVTSGTVRFITEIKAFSVEEDYSYGTIVIPESIFETYKTDIYKGNFEAVAGYINSASSGDNSFKKLDETPSFAVDLKDIPSDKLDTAFSAVTFIKIGDSFIFTEHENIAVSDVVDEVTGEIKVLGSLKDSYLLGSLSYIDPEDIVLSETDLKNTVTEIKEVRKASSLDETGEVVTILTDFKNAPVFKTDKTYVKYIFDEEISVSGIRLIKDKNAGVIRNSKIYGSVDGATWFEIGMLKGVGSGTLITDFGFNLDLTHIAVSFDEGEWDKAAISDMHVIKGLKSYKTIKPSNIESIKIHSPANFECSVDTANPSAGVEKLFDGDYGNYWHSQYIVTSDGVVPVKELPHTVTVNFGEEIVVSGIKYVPRNGSNKITVAEVYGTVNGSDYYLIARGDKWVYSGNEDTNPREILFGENFTLTGIKFVSVETQSNVFSTGAELEIYKRNMGYTDGGILREINLSERLDGKAMGESGIEYAFDGDEKTSFRTTAGEKPSFTFEFDSLTSLSGIKYYSEDGTTLKQADIFVSEDGVNFKKFATASFASSNEYIFKCNLKAKAVKIEAVSTSDTGVSISEFMFLSKYEKYNDVLLSEEIDAKDTWVIDAESQAEYAPAIRIFDGNIETYWHSWHSGNEMDSTPIELYVDFGEMTEISGFNYYPRRSGTAGTFYNVDIYISASDDEAGNPLWEKIKSENFQYKTGNKYEVQRTEFDFNYKAEKVKFNIKYGEGSYASGAEIRFLKPGSDKKITGAELIGKNLAFDPEEPDSVFAKIAFNDSMKLYGISYKGTRLPEGYYAVTEDGITLSTYVFNDFVDENENTAIFTAEFFQGGNLDIPVSIGGIESYKVTFNNENEGGSIKLIAVSPSGSEREVASGETVKTTENLRFEARLNNGYEVSGWKVLNTTKLYEKIQNREGWILDASTTTSESGTYAMIDGKETTYWHSGYTVINGSAELVEEKDKKPYYITITFPEETTIAGFSYLPRQDSSAGRITEYEIYKKGESGNFDTLINKGTLSYENTSDKKERNIIFSESVTLSEVQIKIINTTGVWGHIAELYALRESDAVEGCVTHKGTALEAFGIETLVTDILVTAEFGELSGNANVTYALSNIKAEGAKTVNKGENLVVSFESENDFYMPEALTVMLGDTVLLSGADYTYKRFSDNDARLTVKNVSGDIKVTAAGVDHDSYKVIYRDEYGATGTLPESEYVRYGTTYKIPKTNLTLSGYKFVGWEIYYDGISDNDKKVYATGKNFLMPEKDVTLSAVWEAIKDKDKTDKPQKGGGGGGGSFEITGNLIDVEVAGYGKIKVAKGNSLEPVSKDGYEFLGYYLDEALTVPFSNTGVSESITLYPSFRRIRSADELKDIASHWAKDTIGEMYVSYLVNGKGEGLFDPDAAITRAEFCQILYLISGETSSGYEPFDDVNIGDWYSAAVAWAYDREITKGTTENEFSPYALITREQMATMIYRYATAVGAPWKITSEAGFEDKENFSDYANYQINWASEKGIVKGYPDNTFLPKNNATRAEASVMLSRMMSLIKG